MVKLVTKGAKEIIVLDDIQYPNAEEFFRDIALGHPPGEITVNWSEGVVFTHSAFPWNEITAKEYVEYGRLYWLYVRYAPMKEYKDRVVEGNVVFRIRKIKVPILIEVARELRRKMGLEEE